MSETSASQADQPADDGVGGHEGQKHEIESQPEGEREAIEGRTVSPYTLKEKLMRVGWACVEKTVFRLSFHNWYGFRNRVLRVFGAEIHPTARVRRTVHIEIPWNLTLGEDAIVGDNVTLYCLGQVKVGSFTTISQNAHICAGSHDYTRADFPLLRTPVTIGSHVWVAADAFVGPNVVVGDGAVLGARGVAMKDLEPWGIYSGNPAKLVKRRRQIAA